MTYDQTLNYLYNALPSYQNIGKNAYKEDLDNTYALMDVLNNPHKKFKSIHIAGTNGKGSVSHILAAIFQKCGYKTGLYTSPHLLDFRERIRINGQMISKKSVIDFTTQNKTAFEKIQPSFFEMTVSLAFNTFANEKVDIAIIETGLGGRLDSTNIISPEASVITNISMDHAQFLGNTLEKIASEKAGIIKNNIPCVIGDVAPHLVSIFKNKAIEKRSDFCQSGNEYSIFTQRNTTESNSITYNNNGKQFTVETDLNGKYQAQNIATALSTVDTLNKSGNFHIPGNKTIEALKNVATTTGLRGRWETLQQKPLWIADTGHNEAGIKFIMQQINQLPHKKKTIIYGCVKDKEVEHIFSLFEPSLHYIFTRSQNKRSLEEKKLLHLGEKLKLNCQSTSTMEQAIAKARQQTSPEDAVIICGSTFLIADALKILEK